MMVKLPSTWQEQFCSTPTAVEPIRPENPGHQEFVSARRYRPLFSRVNLMDSMRMAPEGGFALWKPCCRCGKTALGWDHIAGKPYCPACQEAIIQGEIDPLIEPTQRRPCTACRTVGSVTVQTFPLRSKRPLEMELCPEHVRALLGRRLAAHAYFQLQRQIGKLGLKARDVFLLHEAFYDAKGRAKQPAGEPE